MPNRPKQRNLVRWNDDLDKSLLLFITHTCTELGIKLPYDEVARRMGSSFSEGAIQQHIAKLRNQMAELNVAPVPGPPRRGNVTKRPSSVYTQKGRAGAPPPDPPPPSKARARTRTQADDDGQGANGKARPRRRATTRNIKRSASDVGDSDEEFAGASEDDFQPEQVADSRKRKQSGVSRGRVTASRRVSNAQAAAMSKTNDIMRALSDADARFDAMQYDVNDGHQVPGQDNMFNIHNSVEGNDGNAHSTFTPRPSISGFAGYVGNAGQGEEEEEEELPLIARNQLLARQAPAPEPLPFSQEEQISPTSTSHMAMPTMPMTPKPFPHFNAQGQGEFSFSGFPQQLSGEHTFTSNTRDNYDFAGGFGNFNSSASALNSTPAPMPMAPPSTFPAVSTHMSEHNLSSPSTRNASLMSSSTQGNAYHQSVQANSYNYDGGNSAQPSPYSQNSGSWVNVGNAAMDTFSSSPTQPTNAYRHDQDFDFMNHSYNADGSRGDFFDILSGALTGQA
ncbi:hypothetical protein LTR70_003087 [Exophiala xenobiotica]|uniref:Uncharacterized protein n=1 Tax=Lithohypha guttulata TaxID=1690604 RepID=A0ABR0KH72_9EURO|nr:hypothetical protein LTR24_002680 [Lithohypha guttulata]KAK5323798.1 hypothetical protein LTR70_003087 [Exophiala xenobiotica]